MKRLFSLLLVLALILGLPSCAPAPAQQLPDDTYELNIVTDPAGTVPAAAESEAVRTDAPGTDAPAQTDAPPQTEVSDPTEAQTEAADPTEELLDEDGWYNTKEEVALYILQYGKLPGNYITKKEAEALGWPGGSLEPYAPGKSIGGGYFGNYEGLLPVKKGRKYTECDIDTAGRKSRGTKRIVFSNDGLIYYTDDHYETFELLYGEP